MTFEAFLKDEWELLWWETGSISIQGREELMQKLKEVQGVWVEI